MTSDVKSNDGAVRGPWARRRRGPAAVLAVAAAALLSSPLAGPAPATVVNRILATVDGQPITEHQLDTFIEQNAKGIDPATVGEADRRRVLDVLINEMLVDMESQSIGVGAGQEEVEAYIEQIKKRNNLDDERLAQALEAQGLTLDAYREQVRKEIQRSSLVQRQVRAKVTVSDEEVEKYYKEHPEEFEIADSVKVRHIFFPVPPDASPEQMAASLAAAQAAAEQLRGGASFDSVASSASQGSTRGVAGDLGTMKRGQMVPELEMVVFSLKTGESSGPVRGPGGVHILHVDERNASGSVSFEEIREKVKEKLYGSAMEARYQRWIEEDLRSSHEIVIK